MRPLPPPPIPQGLSERAQAELQDAFDEMARLFPKASWHGLDGLSRRSYREIQNELVEVALRGGFDELPPASSSMPPTPIGVEDEGERRLLIESLHARRHRSLRDTSASLGAYPDPDSMRRTLDVAFRETLANALDDAVHGDLSLDQIRSQIRHLALLSGDEQWIDELGLQRLSYDPFQTLEQNQPPEPRVEHIRRFQSSARVDVFGATVDVPFGIGASPLTASAEWVEYWAHMGHDVITLRSFRPTASEGLPMPNWMFTHGGDVAWPVDYTRAQLRSVLAGLGEWPSGRRYSMVNSFGVPSPEVGTWAREVTEAQDICDRLGKVLITSIMGNGRPLDQGDQGSVVESYVLAARAAKDAGARVIEINIGCPNIPVGEDGDDSGLGDETVPLTPQYQDPSRIDGDILRVLVNEVRSGIGQDVKLLAKFGPIDVRHLSEWLPGMVEALDGVVGVNAMQWPVMSVTTGGEAGNDAAFPPRASAQTDDGVEKEFLVHRQNCAISGEAIRMYGLDFVRSARQVVKALSPRNDLAIIGLGGVSSASDVRRMLDAGADVVQVVTAAVLAPEILDDVAHVFGASRV